MLRRMTLMLLVSLAFVGLQAGGASAREMTWLNLPPGVAAHAEPIHEEMMARCEGAGMSPEHMRLMMADIQQLADRLPPGIFLQVLRSMSQLEMAEMMAVHHAVREGGLLQRPPGQILAFVQDLAR